METAAHRSGVAVVAMPLCAVDRRSLSQAWYDAMHLVEHQTSKGSHGSAPLARRAFASRAHTAREVSLPRNSSSVSTAVQHQREKDCTREGLVERRATRATLGRKIAVRLAALPASAPKRVAFSAADGRVQIVVRGEGAQARIIAICTPALRDHVARALLEARYRLAAHGMTADVTVRERVAC